MYRHCFKSSGRTSDHMDQYTSRLHPTCSVRSGIFQTAKREQVEVAFSTHCFTSSWNCFSPVSSYADPWSGRLFFTGHKIPSHYLLCSWIQEHCHLCIPVTNWSAECSSHIRVDTAFPLFIKVSSCIK